MKKLFVIGGMGAGKSTARKALVDEGLPYIDLDVVGHEVLKWDIVKEELREEFGDDVFDENGEVVRRALAAKAFVSPYETRALNRITLPGAIFLACVAVIPSILFFFTDNTLIQAFGGTSILIMVGVALDTMSKVESQLKMHDYEGFFK